MLQRGAARVEAGDVGIRLVDVSNETPLLRSNYPDDYFPTVGHDLLFVAIHKCGRNMCARRNGLKK
jgi:hypothetical protein